MVRKVWISDKKKKKVSQKHKRMRGTGGVVSGNVKFNSYLKIGVPRIAIVAAPRVTVRRL